jgi:hypothetical protein
MATNGSTLGSSCRANVGAAEASLRGNPDTAAEWQIVARQLRAASDQARRIAKLAKAMESQMPVYGVCRNR